MASKVKVSPMNSSFTSPNVLNLSDQFKFLKPEIQSRNFSPFVRNQLHTPNISPIIKPTGSASSFLKKRSLKERTESAQSKARRRTYSFYPAEEPHNQLMDLTLSVKTVLKDLGLSDYSDTFYKEEINLAAFFTLSDEDLIIIGVNDISDRTKILDFINDFKTPEKPKKLQPKNFLHRY
ncbi:unnamed protein product [Chironomus riparius]|uniref:SAM domain-containing protein n=1 Tax=Chironomus riparius TaxID=315576 RepID=A0A9N9RZS7_9DIPT|nr:unnamed protein product [Chironomus riparius]